LYLPVLATAEIGQAPRPSKADRSVKTTPQPPILSTGRRPSSHMSPT